MLNIELPIGKGVFLACKIAFWRELELLDFLAAGRPNQEIASKLYIALGTVKQHSVNIFNKLDLRNCTQAVAKARTLGWT